MDIIIISPFNTETNHWQTTLAHEVGHSILHQDKKIIVKLSHRKKEEQADQFVRDNFSGEDWFEESVLHGGS